MQPWALAVGERAGPGPAEERLVRAAQAGDRAAMDELLARHERRVLVPCGAGEHHSRRVPRFNAPVVKIHPTRGHLYVIDNAGNVYSLNTETLAVEHSVRLRAPS